MKKNVEKNNLTSIILISVLFCLIGLFILYISLKPIAQPYTEVANEVLKFEEYEMCDKTTFERNNAFFSDDIFGPNGIQFPPKSGSRYGKLTIETAGINAPLYYGDGKGELAKGIGTYEGAYLPGQGRTILVCSHNMGYCKGLGNAAVGDKIQIETTYGNYTYTIVDSRIADANDKSAYDLKKNEENVILYTCYPFNAYQTPNRYFVYAKYASGPQIFL